MAENGKGRARNIRAYPWGGASEPAKSTPTQKGCYRFRFKNQADAATIAGFIQRRSPAIRWLAYRCLETGDLILVKPDLDWIFKGMPGTSLVGVYDSRVTTGDLREELA
jgi:hypothetical protein